MKKLFIALMMGLSLIVLDASAATKTCDKDGQYVKGAGKNATCEFCPEGYYCPDGKNKKKCPAGSFCPGYGKGASGIGWAIHPADPTRPYPCEGNTYSSAGQSSCSKKCDGANQIVNSNHTGCTTCSSKLKPNTTRLQFFANTDHTACIPRCSEGQYAKGTDKKKDCLPCEDGYYCPDGVNRKKCPAGSFCKKDEHLRIVPAGGAGATKPYPCTGNTYSSAGQASCSKKCDGANQIVNPNHTGCKNCTAKQQPNADHTACESKCTAGQYVKGTGKNKTCVTCEAGYYCPDGKNHQKCSAGTYAGSGATTCQTCAGNTYSAAGATSCKACPKGKKASPDHTKCVKA